MSDRLYRTGSSTANASTRSSVSRRAPARFGLGPHQTLSLAAARGQLFTVCAGTAWLTLDGDPRDVVLQVGQTFTLPQQGHVVVSSLDGAAWIEVSPALRSWSGRLGIRTTLRDVVRHVLSHVGDVAPFRV